MKLVILLTKGLIRDRNMRRATMFAVALAAMTMVFVGFQFFNDKETNPWLFIFYWLACAWLTMLLLLLALYDMIVMRRRMAEETAKLKSEIFRSTSGGRKEK